jgi:GT2 family glycosyltransferase
VVPTVDVVIPIYGQWELTERCLASLAHSDSCVRRVIVVDDASPDDSAARLKQRRDVEIVLLPENRGFAGACNAGAARANADAILFLNNDTEFEPGTIDRLASALSDRRVAAAGPKLLNGDGTVQSAGLARLCVSQPAFERVAAYLDDDAPEATAPYAPPALSGAALLVRTDAFRAAGGFDEEYRNGYEDVDLGLRLWENGGRLQYVPSAEVVHLEGASRGKLIGDEANARRFRSHWTGRLEKVPCWRPAPIPVLDIRLHAESAVERAVHEAWRQILHRYGGQMAVWNAPLVARARALVERRPVLRPIWCAPRNLSQARDIAARAAEDVWAPSRRAASLLREAGYPKDRIRVVRLGFRIEAPEMQRNRGALLEVRSAGAGEETLRALRAARAAVFHDEGDEWGLLMGTAIAAGVPIVAPESAPIFEVFPHRFTCTRASVETAQAQEQAAAAGRELERRLADVYAARRVRELARVQAGGHFDVHDIEFAAG